MTFTQKRSLTRHLNNCKKKTQMDMQEFMKIKYESEIKDLRIQMLEKHVEKTAETEQFHKKVIECGNNNVDKLIETNMRALTFLNTCYTQGPCLESFDVNFKDPYTFYIDSNNIKMTYDGTNYILDGKEIPKDDYIIKLIINLFNKGEDVKFFVNKIIEYYKNDKFPELQAMWSSDSYRNNYNVRIKVTV
jgi:hypothetical protein